jgi:predicted kinase
MTGLIGSGKSTVAAALDVALFSSDRVRKELAGLRPETPQRAAYGAGLYSQRATQQTYAALAERRRLQALAQQAGAECYLLECRAPESVLRARLRVRERQPQTISDAREELLAQFQRDYEPVGEDEPASCLRLDTTLPPDHCVQQALAGIEARRP